MDFHLTRRLNEENAKVEALQKQLQVGMKSSSSFLLVLFQALEAEDDEWEDVEDWQSENEQWGTDRKKEKVHLEITSGL